MDLSKFFEEQKSSSAVDGIETKEYNVDLGYSHWLKVVVRNGKFVVLKDKLGVWNPLTGFWETSLASSFLVHVVVIIASFLFLRSKVEGFFHSTLFYLWLAGTVYLLSWSAFYLIRLKKAQKRLALTERS